MSLPPWSFVLEWIDWRIRLTLLRGTTGLTRTRMERSEKVIFELKAETFILSVDASHERAAEQHLQDESKTGAHRRSVYQTCRGCEARL